MPHHYLVAMDWMQKAQYEISHAEFTAAAVGDEMLLAPVSTRACPQDVEARKALSREVSDRGSHFDFRRALRMSGT